MPLQLQHNKPYRRGAAWGSQAGWIPCALAGRAELGRHAITLVRFSGETPYVGNVCKRLPALTCTRAGQCAVAATRRGPKHCAHD
jgi:hypothetical protein